MVNSGLSGGGIGVYIVPERHDPKWLLHTLTLSSESSRDTWNGLMKSSVPTLTKLADTRWEGIDAKYLASLHPPVLRSLELFSVCYRQDSISNTYDLVLAELASLTTLETLTLCSDETNGVKSHDFIAWSHLTTLIKLRHLNVFIKVTDPHTWPTTTTTTTRTTMMMISVEDHIMKAKTRAMDIARSMVPLVRHLSLSSSSSSTIGSSDNSGGSLMDVNGMTCDDWLCDHPLGHSDSPMLVPIHYFPYIDHAYNK
jgi:hypothetical protein